MIRYSTAAEMQDWGALRPLRDCESVTDSRGATRVLMPRYGRGRVADWLRRHINPRPVRVRLDDVGAFIWRHCDGAHSVQQIALAMRTEFGQRAEPVEERLVLFLRRMLREKLISVDPNRDGPATAGTREAG